MKNLQILVKFFMLALCLNLLLPAIAVKIYPEPFSLLLDPFSWLGKLETDGGFRNTGGFLLFSAMLLLNALIWRKVCLILAETGFWRNLVPLLCIIVQVGFVIMAFPCDKFVFLHSLGAGLVVGGLWAFTAHLLYYLRREFGSRAHLALQLLLHLTAVYCGFNFFWDTALKGFSQRPLILAITVNLAVSLNTLARNRTEHSLIEVLREEDFKHNNPLLPPHGKTDSIVKKESRRHHFTLA